jgi:hypothetical protein
MATKAKSAPVKTPIKVTIPATTRSLPGVLTTEERLTRIQALAERVDSHVKYICSVKGLNGSSAEAKHQAVADFYDHLVALERQLNKIQEGLRLG